jgi:hypothetical protein
MDPLGLGKIIAEKWDIIWMYPGLFAAVCGLGFCIGLGLTRIFLNERLARHEIRIADLQGVLDGKIPPGFIRTKIKSTPMVTAGLLLALAGLVIAAIGAFSTSTALTPKSTKAANNIAPANPNNSPRLLPDDDGPIKWYPGGYLLGAVGGDPMLITTLQFTGQNTSDEFVEPIGGFVRSEITGKQLPILVNDAGNLASPDGYGIPAKHQFMLGVRLSDSGITSTQFLKEFGRITFNFEYGKRTYTKHFTADEIEAEVRRTELDLRPKTPQSVAGVRKKSQ